MTERGSQDGSVEERVYAAAKRVLDERAAEETESQVWATGSEIAHLTDIDKDQVLAALRTLGDTERLHVRSSAAGEEIEVLGVDHGPGADSLETPVDEG
jgi:hypothetical protein